MQDLARLHLTVSSCHSSNLVQQQSVVEYFMKAAPFSVHLVLFITGLSLCIGANAQLKSIFDRTKRAAEREVQKSVTRTVKETVSCTIDDEKCVKDAQKNGDEVVIVDADGNEITDEEGNSVPDPDEANASTDKPGEGIWRNYDFTPGTRVKFASDWTNARVGRIPRDINFVKGNMEIVEKDGERILEFRSASIFQLILEEPLPESFSIEFNEIDDEKCVKDAQKNGDEVVIVDADGNEITDEEGNSVPDPDEANASTDKPGEGIWRNYDFTPGTRVKFASDWTNARVGRIPRDINFVKGNMEIVEKGGERILEFRSASIFQ